MLCGHHNLAGLWLHAQLAAWGPQLGRPLVDRIHGSQIPLLAHDNLGDGFRLASLIEVNVVDLDPSFAHGVVWLRY